MNNKKMFRRLLTWFWSIGDCELEECICKDKWANITVSCKDTKFQISITEIKEQENEPISTDK